MYRVLVSVGYVTVRPTKNIVIIAVKRDASLQFFDLT